MSAEFQRQNRVNCILSISETATALTPESPDSPIRLALCITELEVGGAERCLMELATRLDRAKFLPVVYSLGPRPTGEQAALVQRLEAAGVPVHFLNGRTRLAAPIVLWKLIRLLRSQNPQIVQSFLFHANLLGTLAAHLAGAPYMVTGIRVAERRRAWHLRWANWTGRLPEPAVVD